ncbi:MAG: hypothetical protein WKF97_19460 [Chitinophagaceae bacterium]
MPKPHTFPTLYDECKTISIGFLKKHGYLQLDHWKSGTITWSVNGNKTGSISIAAYINAADPYLELDYTSNNKPIKYRVPLVNMPSNIGKGIVWYFLCPSTGKQCRKLYLADTYFLHRSAFRGCMYEKQTYSRQNRIRFHAFGKLFRTDDVYDQLHSKHFKKYYKGKPTKQYLKLMKLLNEAEGIDERSLCLVR